MDDEIKQLKENIVVSEKEKTELQDQIGEIDELIVELQTLAEADQIDTEKKKQIVGDLVSSKEARFKVVMLTDGYIDLLGKTVMLKETIIKQQEEIFLLQEKQNKLQEILDSQQKKHAKLVQELAEKHETVRHLKKGNAKLK